MFFEIEEHDQILVPTSTGYKVFNLMNLFGVSSRRLRETRGFGMSPLYFITQRGPQQDGETPIDMRLDVRIVQIAIAERLACRTEFWDRRNATLELLRPNRSFNGIVQPLIYRKWLPAGKVERGSDGVSDGAGTFTSRSGRFITRGGLRINDIVNISGTEYTITSVPNDYTMTTAVVGAGSDLAWSYIRRHASRDLYMLLLRGPDFAEGPGASDLMPTGYIEAIRFIAHDPLWYGADQVQSYGLPESLGDLVFDGFGAWFGESRGSGRWQFEVTGTSQQQSIVYWGTHPSTPTITINGPADDITITNQTSGVQILLEYALSLGETATIDLLALTVLKNDGTNLLPYITGDLALFTLQSEPQSPNRINVITVTFVDGDTDNTTIEIEWKNRFIGI